MMRYLSGGLCVHSAFLLAFLRIKLFRSSGFKEGALVICIKNQEQTQFIYDLINLFLKPRKLRGLFLAAIVRGPLLG